MSTVTNVTAGKPKVGGAIYRAPLNSTLPTDATTALDAAFKLLGYVSDDGLTNSNAITSEDIKAWGGDTVLSIQSDYTDNFQFTLLEVLNVDVLKAVYGSTNVTGALATGITIEANSTEREEGSWVVEMALRDGAVKRIVIPDAKLTELGDIVYSDSEAVGYETTITAYPDASGNTHYEYIIRT